ncbi:MAG: PAS domain S-box protein [Helicobacteraceae bacterium]|nr:PAS domain S-box protein [Helicobacteraceae bacterium]
MSKLIPATTQKEATFHANELFFSITDHNSTIISGNDVFIRVSGYKKEEIIGHYHNIVRHPDMPKIVFKLLWDFIQAQKPIIAYVKNRAKTGEYYWVLAAVFPLKESYVSIRIKPDTKLFRAAQELYGKLLAIESQDNMAKSEEMLPLLLQDLGYKSYEAFMSDAFLNELKAHKKSIPPLEIATQTIQSEFVECLENIQMHTNALMHKYDEWFDKIDLFLEIKTNFEQQSFLLRQIASEIIFLSLNASIASYQVLNGGETFATLAHDVRINAKQNNDLISEIDTIIQAVSLSLNELIFCVCSIRLQSELLNYFIDELLSENGDIDTNEIESNISTLLALITEYSNKTNTLQLELQKQMKKVLDFLLHLEQQMMYLGYIQVFGIIESADNSDKSLDFEEIFSQLKTHIQKTSDALCILQENGTSFDTQNGSLLKQANQTKQLLTSLYECVDAIKV